MTTPKKEGNQWYDVGIIKGTSCLVSYYHLPAEGKQGNGDVGDKKVGENLAVVRNNNFKSCIGNETFL